MAAAAAAAAGSKLVPPPKPVEMTDAQLNALDRSKPAAQALKKRKEGGT
jgi:hypothetical protein